MDLKNLITITGLALALPLGLAACRSETKVYNTPSAESGTMDDVDTRATRTTDQVHVVGEPDDPNDRDEDRVEMRTRTEREIRSGHEHDRDADVDVDIDND
jgi:hypothetical protein